MQNDPRPGRPTAERRYSGWAGLTVVFGVVLCVAGVAPALKSGEHLAVIGDNEVLVVLGAILINLGLLVIIQEWSGLT